jgi:hypothetical protein
VKEVEMISVRSQQPVVSRRGHVDVSDVASFIRGTLDELRSEIQRQRLDVEGPPFCIRQPGPDHQVDVEVGWPVAVGAAAGRVVLCALPAGLVRRSSDYDDALS